MMQSNTNGCDYEDELVSYLYGEIDDEERFAFQKHLQECSACRSEIASLGVIRNSIGAWKHEALGGFTLTEPLVQRTVEKKSARAAIKQFFNLSPLWMKGAVGFATILFCILAVLAFARLTSPEKKVATFAQPNAVYTQPDLEAAVKAAVQRNSGEQTSSTNQNVVVVNGPQSKKSTVHSRMKSGQELLSRRPLTKAERAQLAADLRLTNTRDENGVDLLGEHINY